MKRELYLTSKSAKEIGYELGFNDKYYFAVLQNQSRCFATTLS
ncbi:MAG: hypothetical protein ABJA79_06940 [Parafilimonas sp.]